VDWTAYFRQNRANRLSIPWERKVVVEPHLHKHLARSLQRFQMGERGDGSHLKKVAATTGDRAYMEAVALFIEEEQEHAALMARVLASMGVSLLQRHWSDGAFRMLCLASGLRAELMVLLAAEIIAKRYFRLLYESTADPVLRAVCAQIRHDEDAHIAFHADTLRAAFAGMPYYTQRMVCSSWRQFFKGVCMVVLYDHRKLLRAAGVRPGVFLRDCMDIFEVVAQQVFTPSFTLETATPVWSSEYESCWNSSRRSG